MIQSEADVATFMITDQNGERLRPYKLIKPPPTGLNTFWVIGCWEPVANVFYKKNLFVSSLDPDIYASYCTL